MSRTRSRGGSQGRVRDSGRRSSRGGAGQGSADGREAHRRSVGLTPRPVAGRRGRDRGVQSRRAVRRVAHAARANSTERPLLLVLEDLHWADEGYSTSSTISPTGPRHRCSSSRSHAPSSWSGAHVGRGKRNAMSITLEPLTPARLRRSSGSCSGDPSGAARTLVERSEGNPSSGRRSSACSSSKAPLRAAAAGRWELAAEPGDVEVPDRSGGHRRSPRRVPRRDRRRSGSGRRRPRVLGRVRPSISGTAGGRRARSSATPPCPRHPRRARDLQLLGRAGACVQARVDPRRRVRVAAEEPARRRTRRDGRLGGGASERRRDAGAPATHYVARSATSRLGGERDGRRELVQAQTYRWARRR